MILGYSIYFYDERQPPITLQPATQSTNSNQHGPTSTFPSTRPIIIWRRCTSTWVTVRQRTATHVSRAILAIITYVRTSYFKGTSQISEVLWKYFGSDEVLLKYVMYLLLLKYKIAISVSNPSISTMTSGMLFISILYSLFILYSSAHLCRQPSVSRRHPAASGHGHGHGGWRRVHGGYALAEASASASAAVTSRSRTHHYHSQSLSHTHTHLTITIHTLISASPPPMQND